MKSTLSSPRRPALVLGLAAVLASLSVWAVQPPAQSAPLGQASATLAPLDVMLLVHRADLPLSSRPASHPAAQGGQSR